VGFWEWLAVQVILFVAAELLRPKPKIEDAKPAALGDFDFPTATESRVIPLIWGTVKMRGPNVVWYGDFRQEAITKEIKTGLFSKEEQVIGYRYFLGVQFALCRGPVDHLRTIWINEVAVFTAGGIKDAFPGVAGSGYKVGDFLTLVGGTGTPARVQVLVVNSSGRPLTIRIVNGGDYQSLPSSPAATTGGSGTGATVAFSSSGSPITHVGLVDVECPELFGGERTQADGGGIGGTLQFFGGTDTQLASSYLSDNALASAEISSGGTGYVADEIVEVQGGTSTRKAQVRVAIVSSGVVTSVQLLDGGEYTVFPTAPASTTSLTGVGTGLTLSFEPSPGFQSIGGVTPTYRRTCYLVPSGEALYLGNSTSIAPWAFELRRIPNGLGLGTASVNAGADANPMNVMYELLTNVEWGLKQSASSIDVSSFTSAATTLASEGNGFSMVLDRPTPAIEIKRLIEQQIDGVVFFNQLAGKWQCNLARGGYDVNALPQLTTANIVEVESFARGAWEDTTNQVSVKFVDRAEEYKETSALAQDGANIQILQGRIIPVEFDMPGVKDATLANNLAWRGLRAQSNPLAKAIIVANRTAYSVQPGQVVALTYAIGGESFVKLPMRVGDVDYGELSDGRIRLSVIQDVFQTASGSFAPPGPTDWAPPQDVLSPFVYRSVFEAPRAFVRRDPFTGGQILDKVWAGARRVGPEVGFKIAERHAVGSPSGSFAEVATVYGLFLVGRLSSSVPIGSAVPLTSLTMAPGPDLRDSLEALFTDSTDPSDLGTNLVNLILVDGEFMLVTSAQTSGANVQLNGVYRGVMDSVQQAHSAGAPVYLLFVAGGLSDSPVPAGNNVEVKLLPFSRSDQLADTADAATSFLMDNRIRRPYPPSRISLDGTAWSSSTSMEANGSGPESYAIDVSDVRRRDYRTLDEAQALTVDAASLFSDFPAANTTVHLIDVRNDPAGANTLLFTTATFSGTQKDVRRIEILKATDGVIPTTLRLEVASRHSHESVSYDSRSKLRHDFSVTTALSGQFNLGALDTSDVSNLYTATVAGNYSFTLSSAFTAGDVEFRLNAGAWTTLIAAGGTSGTINGVAISDTIEVRHLSSDSGALKQLDMNAPGAGQDGYAILFV
jgi:hypothetical protein